MTHQNTRCFPNGCTCTYVRQSFLKQAFYILRKINYDIRCCNNYFSLHVYCTAKYIFFVSKFEYYLVDIVIRSKNYLQKCRGASFSSKTSCKTVEGLFFFYVSINMCFCTFGDEIDISSSLLSSSIKT